MNHKAGYEDPCFTKKWHLACCNVSSLCIMSIFSSKSGWYWHGVCRTIEIESESLQKCFNCGVLRFQWLYTRMGKRASRKWQKVSRCSRNEKQKTLLAFCEMYVIVSLLISERNKLILQSNHTIQLGTGTQGKRGNSVNRRWGKEKEGKAETVSCWDVGDWCQDDSSLLFVLLPSLDEKKTI